MNILTFDIEDWYCNCVFTDLNWDKYEVRLYEGVDEILTELNSRNIKATFFCLGWIADNHPDIIKRIHRAGHHIGCHSYQHQLLNEFNRQQFTEDTKRSKYALEDLIGEEVDAYRAPAWTVNKNNIWVLEILGDLGFKYDSSIFPAKHSFGGFPDYGEVEPSNLLLENGKIIKEFPVSIHTILGEKIIFSGGGYFRFFPYKLIRRWMKEKSYNMTYFHTQDFDKGQPKLKELPIVRQFKTYYGIDRAFVKFQHFLDDFDFVNIRKADELINWDSKLMKKI